MSEDHSWAQVLIVDDTPDLRLLLQLSLSRYQGVTVVGEAGDGQQGVDLAREYQPDVVLLDLAMPRMDGLQALPLIREVAPDARVIVLSGFDESRMAGAATAAGAHAYLRKGASPDELIATVASVLGRPVPALRARPGRPSPVPTASRLRPPEPAPTPPPVPTRADGVEPSDEAEEQHRLLARAAHELRNPTIALTVLADELAAHRDDLTGELVDRIVTAIVRQAGILDQVTTDLLTSSHVRRGSLVVNPRPVALAPALQEAVEGFEAGDLTIEISCPADLMVMADRVRVQQIISNLLTNAVRYGAPPISIRATVAENTAEIRVVDRGPGVPAWFLDRLFDEYTRATPDDGVGTGIGLFVVRSLAQAQGGDAWYEPFLGGASFCISLPLVVPAPVPQPSAACTGS